MPGPGSRFGQEVTMRQRVLAFCASAGAAMMPARPSTLVRVILRRVILVIVATSARTIGLLVTSYGIKSRRRAGAAKRLHAWDFSDTGEAPRQRWRVRWERISASPEWIGSNGSTGTGCENTGPSGPAR